ncbi:MAG: FtsH protease activity modulator HflK [Bacillota bacterium]
MKSKRYFVLLLILTAYLATGFFTVESGEEAAILRFGSLKRVIRQGGLKWHLPSPIETVIIEKVSEVKRLEFGFRTLQGGSKNQLAQYREEETEALMLTGDENLIYVETIVQYRVVDLEKYLFRVDDQAGTLRVAAESTIRRAIANHTLDDALTENKFTIQQEIKDDLQGIADKYNLGVVIAVVQLQDVQPPKEVDAAFKDVASAKEDKNSYINQAQSYANEVIPQARGNAAEAINKALAYKETRIAEARGDVAKFVQILEKYQESPKVTRTRMYLEMVQEIFPNMEKYVVPSDGTMTFLPLVPYGVPSGSSEGGK